MAIPTVERPPGIRTPWLDIWRGALKDMKESGVWRPALRPLLDEYVYALRAAAEMREESAAQWDRHARRASALADQLCLSPRGRKAAELMEDDDDSQSKPLANLDELTAKRQARAS